MSYGNGLSALARGTRSVITQLLLEFTTFAGAGNTSLLSLILPSHRFIPARGTPVWLESPRAACSNGLSAGAGNTLFYVMAIVLWLRYLSAAGAGNTRYLDLVKRPDRRAYSAGAGNTLTLLSRRIHLWFIRQAGNTSYIWRYVAGQWFILPGAGEHGKSGSQVTVPTVVYSLAGNTGPLTRRNDRARFIRWRVEHARRSSPRKRTAVYPLARGNTPCGPAAHTWFILAGAGNTV